MLNLKFKTLKEELPISGQCVVYFDPTQEGDDGFTHLELHTGSVAYVQESEDGFEDDVDEYVEGCTFMIGDKTFDPKTDLVFWAPHDDVFDAIETAIQENGK